MIISTQDWPGSRQELETAVAAFQARITAHALTVGVAAPVAEIPIVGQIVTNGGSFLLAREVEDGAEAPSPTRIGEIEARLVAIDRAAIRPLRALVLGVATQTDSDTLAALEAEAEDLRHQRATLSSP